MGASRLIKSSWRHAPRDQSWPSVGKTLARATMGQKRAGFNADAPSGSRGAQCRRDVTRTGSDRNSETRTTLGVENERAPRTCASCNASRADLRGFIIISPLGALHTRPASSPVPVPVPVHALLRVTISSGVQTEPLALVLASRFNSYSRRADPPLTCSAPFRYRLVQQCPIVLSSTPPKAVVAPRSDLTLTP